MHNFFIDPQDLFLLIFFDPVLCSLTHENKSDGHWVISWLFWVGSMYWFWTSQWLHVWYLFIGLFVQKFSTSKKVLNRHHADLFPNERVESLGICLWYNSSVTGHLLFIMEMHAGREGGGEIERGECTSYEHHSIEAKSMVYVTVYIAPLLSLPLHTHTHTHTFTAGTP